MTRMVKITRDVVCTWCGQEHPITEETEIDVQHLCKYPTDSGPCERDVSSPTEYCWQHTDG